MMLDINVIKHNFNDKIEMFLVRPGVYKILAPFYYEDGDMIDIYITEAPTGNDFIRIFDYGMTYMHISYEFDIDTDNKWRIVNEILNDYNLIDENGNIISDIKSDDIFAGIMNYSQAIAKVSSISILKRNFVKSMFYEYFGDEIQEKFSKYSPIADYQPIENDPVYTVDYRIVVNQKNIFLFGIKDQAKARLAVISCQQFQLKNINYVSVAVFDDYAILPAKDKTRILNVMDKQFSDLDQFRESGLDTILRISSK